MCGDVLAIQQDSEKVNGLCSQLAVAAMPLIALYLLRRGGNV